MILWRIERKDDGECQTDDKRAPKIPVSKELVVATFWRVEYKYKLGIDRVEITHLFGISSISYK